ncbi:enoyl-CoA hydratase/isomerase-like protein [Paraburkholderia sp. BL23I1N1]|nr:enoyl-CoA hydratase/isomerase-like protein [Paraburkholderia sp. BL23I1N1]
MRRVHYVCVDGVATITLDSPPVNALSLAVRSEMLRAFEWEKADEHARAVILTGDGKGFCAGGDIGEFGTPAAAAPPGLSLHIHLLIESMNKPVVAAMQVIYNMLMASDEVRLQRERFFNRK